MYARSAIILGSLRLSPLALGVSVSLFVHTGLFTALHFTHRTPSPHPPIAPALVTFSLGTPVKPAPPAPVELLRQEPRLIPLEQTDSPPGLTLPRFPAPLRVNFPAPPPAALPIPPPNQKKQPPPEAPDHADPKIKHPHPKVIIPKAPDTPLNIPTPPTESPAAPPPGHNAGVAILNLPAPIYPRSCRRHGHEGLVKVRVEIDANGRVKSIHIIKNGGCLHLDRAALKAARQGHYTPAQRKGKAVKDAIIIPFRFVLK